MSEKGNARNGCHFAPGLNKVRKYRNHMKKFSGPEIRSQRVKTEFFLSFFFFLSLLQ